MALDQAVPAGLEALIMDPAAMQRYKQNLVDSASMDINREAGNSTQAALENAFARGVGTAPAGATAGMGPGGTGGPGLSSITAYNASLIEQARAKAIAQASLNADSQVQAAQRAALGEAAGYVNAQNARAQQESQFSRNLSAQKSMHNQNMLMQGLGGLAGGALKAGGYAFGPAIKGAAGKMFGSEAGKADQEQASPYPTNPLTAGQYQTAGPGEGVAPFSPNTANITAVAPSAAAPASPSSSYSSYSEATDPNYSYNDPSYGFGATQYNPADYGFNLADLLRNDNSDWSF
jgi:hypothetical protein